MDVISVELDVVDRESLVVSIDKEYPFINDRDYSCDELMSENEGFLHNTFEPRLLLTDNPDASNGPPVVVRWKDVDFRENSLPGLGEKLIVLSGNRRSLLLRSDCYKEYKEALAGMEQRLLLRSDCYKKYKEAHGDGGCPVLVRVLSMNEKKISTIDCQRLLRACNNGPVTPLTGIEVECSAAAGYIQSDDLRKELEQIIKGCSGPVQEEFRLDTEPGKGDLNPALSKSKPLMKRLMDENVSSLVNSMGVSGLLRPSEKKFFCVATMIGDEHASKLTRKGAEFFLNICAAYHLGEGLSDPGLFTAFYRELSSAKHEVMFKAYRSALPALIDPKNCSKDEKTILIAGLRQALIPVSTNEETPPLGANSSKTNAEGVLADSENPEIKLMRKIQATITVDEEELKRATALWKGMKPNMAAKQIAIHLKNIAVGEPAREGGKCQRSSKKKTMEKRDADLKTAVRAAMASGVKRKDLGAGTDPNIQRLDPSAKELKGIFQEINSERKNVIEKALAGGPNENPHKLLEMINVRLSSAGLKQLDAEGLKNFRRKTRKVV